MRRLISSGWTQSQAQYNCRAVGWRWAANELRGCFRGSWVGLAREGASDSHQLVTTC